MEPVSALQKAVPSEHVKEAQRSLMAREASDGSLRVRIMIANLTGREAPEGIEITGGEAQVLIGREPPLPQ
jgi:hypothetical protein